MGLFDFFKKEEKENGAPACACTASRSMSEFPGTACGCGSHASGRIDSLKVLGAGCKSCHEQYEQAKAAVKSMGLSVEVEYITDLQKVMAYGAMSMPALVVNEKVVTMGKVLCAADVIKLLHKLGF